MLRSIGIRNYRGIAEGRVEDLGRVNLFVGPNGSGKSTVLEALFLGANGSNRNFNFDGRPIIQLRHDEDAFPSPHCWFRKDLSRDLLIDYMFADGSMLLKFNADLGIAWTSPPAASSSYFPLMRLLDIRMLLSKSLEWQSWDALVQRRGDRMLRRVTSDVYGLNIESFTYSVNEQVLLLLLSDRDYALKVDDLGAGMRIALRLFMSVLLCKDSAVLAEEFDGYQHIESFPRLVRTLCELSRQNNTQPLPRDAQHGDDPGVRRGGHRASGHGPPRLPDDAQAGRHVPGRRAHRRGRGHARRGRLRRTPEQVVPSDIVAEGDTDRAIVHAITGLEVPAEPGVSGRDNAIRLAAVAAKQSNRQIVLVLDRNGYTPNQIDKEVARETGKIWGGAAERHEGWFLHASTSSAVRLVIAGLPSDPILKELRVKKFAIDDLLLLCLDPEALSEFCKKGQSRAPAQSRDAQSHSRRTRREVARPESASTRASDLDLVRAVVGVQASRATFAQELIRKCPDAVRERVLGALAHEIRTDPPLPFVA